MPYELNYDSFPDCMREFANYKRAIQGCSAKTVEEYMTDLRTFARYLVCVDAGLELSDSALQNADISSLTVEYFGKVTMSEITEFLGYLMDGRENSARTRGRKLSSIKSFYKYLVNKVHKLEYNPAVEIETPRIKKSMPKFLTLDESITLLKSVKEDADDPNRIRNYCILTLFLNCGIRLSELCSINLTSVDSDITEMRIVGKGNKERLIYLNDACRRAILDYMPERLAIRDRELEKAKKEKEKAEKAKKENIPYLPVREVDTKALFVSRLGKRISPKTVQWVVKTYLARAGFEYKAMSTHKLRHTAATLMYQSGEVDIRVLKDILGHEQLNTTQIYTHVSDESMRRAMNNSPLAEETLDGEDGEKSKAP